MKWISYFGCWLKKTSVQKQDPFLFFLIEHNYFAWLNLIENVNNDGPLCGRQISFSHKTSLHNQWRVVLWLISATKMYVIPIILYHLHFGWPRISTYVCHMCVNFEYLTFGSLIKIIWLLSHEISAKMPLKWALLCCTSEHPLLDEAEQKRSVCSVANCIHLYIYKAILLIDDRDSQESLEGRRLCVAELGKQTLGIASAELTRQADPWHSISWTHVADSALISGFWTWVLQS